MLLIGSLALACGGPPADTPSAVILVSPDTVCQGDAHRTRILLDGRMSSRHLTLVPVPPEDTSYPDGAMVTPLTFAWHLDGDEHVVTSGSLTDSALEITVLGERPLHVTLTTTNLAGGSATSLRTLPITLPTDWPRRCTIDAPCPGGACDTAASACVATVHCANDSGCDPCFVCDAATSLCTPRPS
jgi:hypothetical protein